MRRWIILATLLVTCVPGAAAAPLDPALQQDLLALYDRYNKAILAGKLDAAMALRGQERQAQAKREMKTAKQKRDMLEMAQAMTPDSIDVKHATINRAGDKAEIITVGAKTVPKGKLLPGAPPPGTVVHVGLTLSFIREKGVWKFDTPTFGAAPSQIAACKDETYEPDTAYDTDRNLSMGGPIARVDFKPEYTLVVVRVVDEENCTFLPNRAELEKLGLLTDKLVPYAIVEIEGSPHKTDPQKVLVDKLSVQEED
ncbi:MAG: hypothetical protein WDN25_19100 [Acetobacteraceae bacterium]